MKRRIFAALMFVVLTALVSLAQEPATPDNTKQAATQEIQDQKTMGHTKTVTGCLQKGDEAGEFAITGQDGKTWELTSKSVKLDEHVGHQVTVTGPAHRESKAEEKAEKKEGQMEKAAGREEYGDLRVTDLKMVSETCTK